MPPPKKNLLTFPKPQEEENDSTVICQIGEDRFAIHFEIEDLPLPRPAIPIKKGPRS